MAQFGGGQIQGIAIRRQNSPRQCIRRRVIAQIQNLLVAIGRINIDGQNRAKELLAHGPVFGIGRLNQGGFDKIPFGLVTAPPNEDFAIGMLSGFVDGRLQFDFLINIIRKKRRFSKWFKATDDENLNVIKEYYGYSNEKAKSVLSLLNDEQLQELKNRIYKGGKRK